MPFSADETVLFEHPLVRAVAVVGQTPVGPRSFLRLQIADWVNVVAVTADGEVVLVRQHRWGIDRETLEVPGGIVDPGETPAQAVLRELQEETGFGGGTLHPMGVVWANPAIQTNRTWLYAARGVTRISEPRPDDTESLRVELCPVSRVPALLASGDIDHVIVVAALQRFLLTHPGA